MDVIHTLVEHYQQDYKTDDGDDCLATHEPLRLPEEPYELNRGGKYPHMLSNTRDAEQYRGSTRTHELLGVRPPRLGAVKVFGTAI